MKACRRTRKNCFTHHTSRSIAIIKTKTSHFLRQNHQNSSYSISNFISLSWVSSHFPVLSYSFPPRVREITSTFIKNATIFLEFLIKLLSVTLSRPGVIRLILLRLRAKQKKKQSDKIPRYCTFLLELSLTILFDAVKFRYFAAPTSDSLMKWLTCVYVYIFMLL